ncbi:MAG: SGNH/GDSL hydrolase family protein [Actinomycetota bacterium]
MQNLKKIKKFGFLVVLPLLASVTPMYFDRWHRGMLTSFVLTLVAVSLVYWLDSKKIFTRFSLGFFFLAICLPTTFLLWGKQAALLQFVWSGVLMLVFTSRMRWYRIVAINVVITVVLFSIYEYAIREMEVSRRPPGNWTLAPLMRKILECEYEVLSDGDLLSMTDCRGESINVRDGRRVTVGSPPNPTGRILMFGGSTLFCGEVADEFTISSLLQKSINDRSLNYEVLNFGVPGARSIHQLEKLKTIDLKPSDIIIFYDGGNDAIKIYNNIRDSHASKTPRRQAKKLLETIEQRSKVFFNAFLSDRLMYIDQNSIISESKEQVGDSWLAPIDVARNLAKTKGAKFFHVLQPNLFTYAHSGPRGSMGNDMAAVYTAFRDEVRVRKEADFTKIFDDSKVSPYLNWMHIVADGNRTVAMAFAKIIEK